MKHEWTNIKWKKQITVKYYIDEETGEMITEEKFKNEYYENKKKTEHKYKYSYNRKFSIWYHVGKKHNQQRAI